MAGRLIAYLLLLCYLPACTAWRVERGVRPQQLFATAHPDTVRVTRKDRSRVVIAHASLALDDTVSGSNWGTPIRIALADITQVEARKHSAAHTVGAVLVVSVVTFGIAVVAARDEDGTGAMHRGMLVVLTRRPVTSAAPPLAPGIAPAGPLGDRP